jgi:hypothetical protein
MSKQESFLSFSSFALPGENVQEGEAVSLIPPGKERKRQRIANSGQKMLDIRDKESNIKTLGISS